jgi:hypothetical protein
VSTRGMTLVEALVALGVVAAAVLAAAPAVARLRDSGRAAAGARLIAGTFGQMRWRSVAQRRAHGVLFERDARGWGWRLAADGNGNGMRTAEVRSGVDRVIAGPVRLEEAVSGVSVGFPPGGPFPAIPPDRGVLDPADPVQFGRSDLVGFGGLGTGSSGTVYLTDGRSGLYAVVLFGPTCRVRLWRFDPWTRRWRR